MSHKFEERLDAAIREMEAEIQAKQKQRELFEWLTRNDLEIAIAKDRNTWLRLLHLRASIEQPDPPTVEGSLIPQFSSIGEPKISISTAADLTENEEEEGES